MPFATQASWPPHQPQPQPHPPPLGNSPQSKKRNHGGQHFHLPAGPTDGICVTPNHDDYRAARSGSSLIASTLSSIAFSQLVNTKYSKQAELGRGSFGQALLVKNKLTG